MKENTPFIRFNHLGDDKTIMTNIFGESIVLNNSEFSTFINGGKLEESLEKELKDKEFFNNENYTENAIQKYRERNYINFIGPTLHIIVLTKGCNHQCKYCHAAADYRYTDEKLKISNENTKKIIDIILESPSKNLTIEFQGGEPLTNMEAIDFAIKYCEEQNKKTKKNIKYAIVTNLTLINEEIADKLLKYPNLSLSTSIDGDKHIHDFNRLMLGKTGTTSSFNALKEKIELLRKKEKEYGKKILHGAMGVITNKSLKKHKEIIDTYIELGFDNIFLKKMNSIGFGEKSKNILGYTNEELKEFYKNHFNYLVELNENGTFIKDGFLSILMGKILNPENMNFMDLRSPCGAGIGQIAYDYTGNIYTCDEGRMMNDETFKIGDVNNSLEELIQNEIVGAMMDASTVESLPCDICAYAPYCGVCPIESYQARGNIYTNQIFDSHCNFFMFIFDWIFEKLNDKNSKEYKYLNKLSK